MLFDERSSHGPLSLRSSGILLALAVTLTAGLATLHPGRLEARSPVVPAQATQGETHPITITGRALDPAGKPIAGAKVYVASYATDYKWLAEATTDAQGRYELKDVPLPIQKTTSVSYRDRGSFQIFGQAEGFGFAYRPSKLFHPRPRPLDGTYRTPFNEPTGYELGQAITLDLNFGPAARIGGTIFDDRGKPIVGARLEIRDCNSHDVGSFYVLKQRDDAPASLKFRLTDADGKFEFAGLPADCDLRISMTANGFPERQIEATTAGGPVAFPPYGGLKDGFKLAIPTPVDVQITVVAGDTGLPMPGVFVEARSGLVNTAQTSDDLGRSTLRLPLGRFYLNLLPARGTDYLETASWFVVGANPPAEPIVARLKPAAVVEVTVVDAETGKGLPNVDLWRDLQGGRMAASYRSWEVATRTAHVDHPRTNAQGVLRILVRPGTDRFGVGYDSFLRGYSAVESKGQEVEARAGETTRLKFTMRKHR